MALGNAKQSEGSIRTLYTGAVNLKPVLINPNESELEALLGRKPEKVREYTNIELNGKMYSKVIIFLQGQGLNDENFIVSTEFLVSPRTRVSQTGKKQYINNAGLTSWAVDENSLQEWFIAKGGVRECKEGEEDLLKFFTALGRLDTYAEKPEIYFEDFSKIANGNVSELKSYIMSNEVFATRSVKCLVYIQKEKYMKVWTKAFDIQEAVIPKNIKKELENQPLKDGETFQDSFEMQIFNQPAQAEVEKSTSDDDQPF